MPLEKKSGLCSAGRERIDPMKTLLLCSIRFYQYGISPFLGSRCRFFPSCSEYAAEAIEKYGALKGLYYGMKRILRCNPWNPGGVDPLP
jgi:putative membrane protein insertion efficiency factor